MFYFYFCAHLFATFSPMISTVTIYIQNHPEMKYLYEDFFLAFAGILSASSGISPCQNGMRNNPASYKHSIKK